MPIMRVHLWVTILRFRPQDRIGRIAIEEQEWEPQVYTDASDREGSDASPPEKIISYAKDQALGAA